jgi:hypothetical protein
MNVSYVGLSCFLLENRVGGRVLVDPYKDTPEYFLGLNFPRDLQADLFFVSHPDDDHSNLYSNLLSKRRPSNEMADDADLFPDINIRGVLVKEFNGDLNIAYSFTLDDLRVVHLADNAHALSDRQLNEIGEVDIVFISPPKVPGTNYYIENIRKLKPKVAFVSHIIPPETDSEFPSKEEVRSSIQQKLYPDLTKNPHANDTTLEVFTNMFFEGLRLKDSFNFEQVFGSKISIDKSDLTNETKVYFFRKCLGS